MSVILTHGYFLNEDAQEQKIMRPYPPLGLLYISAYLNEKNISNEVFDSTFSTYSELLNYLDQKQPKILAIYTNLMTKINVLKIIRNVKIEYPDVNVLLGGPDVTYNSLDYLKSGADYIVIGEGEQTTFELAEYLLGKEMDIQQIDGIAYLDQNGLEVRNKPRTKIKDINSLPVPNRGAIDMHLYLDAWRRFHGMSALNVSTQRGCPYTCKWCSTAVYGQSYRRRSPEKVVSELKEIQEKFNPDSIWFVDDVFTVSHVWLNEFVEEIDKQDLQIKFECITRADRMNEDVINLLRRAGCFRVWIGAESGSQKIVDAMDRRVSIDQVRNMIQQSGKVGIETGTFIMLGYPGETEKDIKATIQHLKSSNPDHFTITVAYPIKGTTLYQEIESRQTKDLDWEKSTDRDRDFKRTYPKSYYHFAVRHVVNEVGAFQSFEKHGMNLDGIKKKLKSTTALLGMKLVRSLPYS